MLDSYLLRNDKASYAKLDAYLNEPVPGGGGTMVPRLQAGLEAPSAYGAENRYEFVAEAFADWWWNGENAKPSSQAIGRIFDESPATGTPAWAGSAGAAGDSLDGIAEAYRGRGAEVEMYESGNQITLSKIVAPERGQGLGTEFMNELLEYADRGDKTIALTPSADFGGSKARLIEFYKRFGFVENKGRNRDLEISESMYRPAAVAELAPA